MPWFDLDEDYISGAKANNRRKRRGDAQPYWGCYRFRDATLVAEKKDDFGSALQNLYRGLERAENLVGPS